VGLATGTGTGSQIKTHAKPIPVAWVCGCVVAAPSKKGTPHQLGITTTTTMSQQQQQLHTTMQPQCTLHNKCQHRTQQATTYSAQ
jgi:hypothetical protein